MPANRWVSLAAAIIAVLAALSTLFAHHRSISALSWKNQAILTQARASDTYNTYEAKQIRSNIYRALLTSDLVVNAKRRALLQAAQEQETASADATLARARAFEQDVERNDNRSEAVMKSFETLQLATVMFEISIVLISISTFVAGKLFLPLCSVCSALGVIFLALGLAQGR